MEVGNVKVALLRNVFLYILQAGRNLVCMCELNGGGGVELVRYESEITGNREEVQEMYIQRNFRRMTTTIMMMILLIDSYFSSPLSLSSPSL